MDSAVANEKGNFLSVSVGRAKRESAILQLARLQLRRAAVQGGWFGI